MVEVEDPIEIAHLEHPSDPRLGNDDPEVAVEQPGPLQCADDHAQPEGVDEVDAGEIEDEVRSAVAHLRHDGLAEIGTADDIEFTRDGEHRPRTIAVRVRHDLHTVTLIRSRPRAEPHRATPLRRRKPHACDSVTPVS